MNLRSNVLPYAVDRVEGEANIADKWKIEFKNRFNCLENSQPVGLHNQQCDYKPVSIEGVTVLSERLSSGKSKGYDGIPE